MSAVAFVAALRGSEATGSAGQGSSLAHDDAVRRDT
jgi:hypothetical protein